MTTTNNWADLNGDLLNMILSNLFGKDRHSFGLVCRHWNAVATTSPYRYSPCLMYYNRRAHAWKFYQYDSFFTAIFPELEKAEIRCSKHGWLLMSRYEDDDIFFFDPSNNRKIDLPCKVGPRNISLSFFNPPTSPDCVVIGIEVRSSVEMIVCMLYHGDDDWWDFVDYSIENSFSLSRGPLVLHRGLVHLVDASGDVATLDIEEQFLDVYSKCLGLESYDDIDILEQYLVKVKEELYGVLVFDEERTVKVYKLSSEERKWDLVEGGIGDKVLYVSPVSSFGFKALDKKLENTICFPKFHGDDVAVFYSLSDGKYHSLDGDYSEDNAYGLKGFDLAAWIMPIPALEAAAGFSTSLSWLT